MKGTFNQEDVKKIKQSVRKDSYWLFFKKYLEGVVTELGCGTGANAILSKNMHNVTRFNAIDGSKAMLKFVEIEKIPKVKMYCKNIDGKVSLPKSDVVISKFMFHHIKNKKKLLQSVYKCLEKGGKLVLIDKFPRIPWKVDLQERFLKFLKLKHVFGTHYYSSYKEFLLMARQVGFKLESEKIKPGKKIKNMYVKRAFLVFKK